MPIISKFELFNENNIFSKVSGFFKNKPEKDTNKITTVDMLNDHFIWVETSDIYTYKFYYLLGCKIENNRPIGSTSNKRLVGRIFKSLDEWGNQTLKLYAYLYDIDLKNKKGRKMKKMDPDDDIVKELMNQTIQPYFKLREINTDAEELLDKFLEFWYGTIPGSKREYYLRLPEEVRNPTLKPSTSMISVKQRDNK